MTAFGGVVVSELTEYLLSIGNIIPGAPMTANDASLTNPRNMVSAKAFGNLVKIKARVNESIKANPELFRSNIEKFIALNMRRWVDGTERASRKIAEWYVRNCAADITRSQAKALEAAGVSMDWVKERWRVPTVSRRYIPPAVSAKLPEMVQRNVDLITKTAADDLVRIQEAFTEGLLSGNEAESLKGALEQTEGFSDARINRIVIDQTNKISNDIQVQNCSDLGIERGVWIHVPGQYSSRASHIEMDGQVFNLAEGCFDPHEGRKVQCGELPYCRCEFRMLLPADLMKGIDNDD